MKTYALVNAILLIYKPITVYYIYVSEKRYISPACPHSYTLHFVSNNFGSRLDNGTYDGATGLLINKVTKLYSGNLNKLFNYGKIELPLFKHLNILFTLTYNY